MAQLANEPAGSSTVVRSPKPCLASPESQMRSCRYRWSRNLIKARSKTAPMMIGMVNGSRSLVAIPSTVPAAGASIYVLDDTMIVHPLSWLVN